MTMTKDTKSPARHRISRRAFLKRTAGTAALLAAAKTSFIGGVHIAEAAGPR